MKEDSLVMGMQRCLFPLWEHSILLKKFSCFPS